MPGIETFSPLPTASIRMSLKAESTASALVLLVSAFSASAATRSLRESATDAPKNDGLVFLPASLRIGLAHVAPGPSMRPATSPRGRGVDEVRQRLEVGRPWP